MSTLLLAVWIGILALQLADVVLTASRLPQLSAFEAIKVELADAQGKRLTTEQLEAYRKQITALDEREAARAVPPGRGANSQLWRGTPWRLVPVALSAVPILLTSSEWPASLIAIALPVLSYVLALAAARASVAASSARIAVHELQRVEIEDLLDRASRSSRKRVAGLGDRVTRALQILREQQN